MALIATYGAILVGCIVDHERVRTLTGRAFDCSIPL